MKKVILSAVAALFIYCAQAQESISGIINAYTAVQSIDYCNNALQVSTTNGFAEGDALMLIQMQGAAINVSNTAAYGSVTDLGQAGLYERAVIAAINGLEITLEKAQDALADILRATDRKVTVEEIQRKVAEHYNIRLSDLIGPKRVRTIARPRQIAMYLCKSLTSRSLPEIGRRFGGRDHTTIMHGVRRIEELKATDGQIAEDVEMLRRALEA